VVPAGGSNEKGGCVRKRGKMKKKLEFTIQNEMGKREISPRSAKKRRKKEAIVSTSLHDNQGGG